jgi:hypothetical protein
MTFHVYHTIDLRRSLKRACLAAHADQTYTIKRINLIMIVDLSNADGIYRALSVGIPVSPLSMLNIYLLVPVRAFRFPLAC